MVVIRAVETRLIFDSCGNPTVEVGILFDDGTFARVSLPIEDSTGVYSDYLGEDVLEVVNSIIRPALIGKDLTDLIMCLMVRELNVIAFEGGWCKEKRKLGFKAVWAIVLAVCKAKAVVQNKFLLNEHIAKKTLELPVAAFNVINGGSHAGHKLTMQECMSLLVGASSFTEAGKMGVECEEKAIKEDYNALLMKVNQISSVVESIEAKLAGHGVMASHQSGETEDTLYTGQLKSGAPCRSDRLAKYNQLLMIVESFANFICDLAKLLRVHLARSNQEE